MFYIINIIFVFYYKYQTLLNGELKVKIKKKRKEKCSI